MSLLVDTGALIAVERGDREAIALVKRERLRGSAPRCHGGIVGQAWRGGRDRQVRLARFLAGVDVVPLDDLLGRRAGVLLGRARTSDVIDAALVVLADDGDEILTSDPVDIARLAEALDLHVDVVEV